VVQAMDFLAHKRGLDRRCFHLTDPEPHRIGEMMNLFASAAHAPAFAMRIDSRMIQMVPKGMRQMLGQLPAVQRVLDSVLADFGIPRQMLPYLNYPTRFDCKATLEALEDSGIECPRLNDYAWVLWDYWERHLDPDLFRARTLQETVRDRVVVITGGSSGIGRAAAFKIAAAGAKVVLVARSKEKLAEVKKEITAAGGKVYTYPADLSHMEECDQVLEAILKDHGAVDVLVNNAGRSIRRGVENALDRFHDYQRTMQLNYFGAVKLILGVLPSMLEKQHGQIVNVSTIGVLANTPRFSAYVASKAALDAFSRCVRGELLHKDIHFTTINMPLVRTPMIGPTGFYSHVPAMTPEEAADLIVQAIVGKPRRVATRLGIFALLTTTLMPSLADGILNMAYKMFPETRAAKGEKEGKDEEPTAEAYVFASIMRGIYW